MKDDDEDNDNNNEGDDSGTDINSDDDIGVFFMKIIFVKNSVIFLKIIFLKVILIKNGVKRKYSDTGNGEIILFKKVIRWGIGINFYIF